MCFLFILFASVILGSSTNAHSQQELPDGSIQGKPWIGQRGITESVARIMSRAQALHAPSSIESREEEDDHRMLPAPGLRSQNPYAPSVSSWPPQRGDTRDPAGVSGPLSPQTIGVDFEGASFHEHHYYTPDCDGAIGPSQFLLFVNGTVRTFTRSGVADGALNMMDTLFFTPPVRSGDYIIDPHVIFDRLSQRWFILEVTQNINLTANRIMLAVSSGSTITSSSNFTFYEFRHDSVGGYPNVDTNALADYPSFGVDANALYIGVNIFGPPNNPLFKGSTAFVVRKSSVLSGGPIVVTAFRHTAASTGAGTFSPQGVTNDDPSATEGYFVGVDAATFGLLNVRRVTNPGGTPSMSADLHITVPTTSLPADVPQSGITMKLRGGFDDRLCSGVMKSGSLWTAHAISVDNHGIASTATGARDGIRFYEITNLSGSPALRQSGTLYDTLAGGPHWFWIPSIAMSGQRHVAIGCSFAGQNDHAGVAYAGRLSGDPLGSIRTPTLFNGLSSYNPACPTCPPQSWGDFSITSVDPTDNMTIWTVQEYCDSMNSWGVRVTQLKAPPPSTPIAAAPDSVLRGTANVDIALTGTMSFAAGSGFYDPGSAYPRRISAVVNGGGVTVNSVTFTDSVDLVLNISVDPGATIGSRTIAIMNPDSQTAASVKGILTITKPPDAVVEVPLAGQWNMVSNPVGSGNDSTRVLFPGASSPAFSYTSGIGYQVADRISNGVGCWIRFLSPETTMITGAPLTSDSVFMSAGWNLIGSLSEPISVSSITSTPPGIITSRFFGYAGSYKTTDTLIPGQGYWVKVSQAGLMRFSAAGAAIASNRIRIVPTGELPPGPPDGKGSAVRNVVPAEFALEQNYPNPFNPTTVIRYQLPVDSRVTIKIYDVLGDEIATLLDGTEGAAFRSVEWDGSGHASGIYFYRIRATDLHNPEVTFDQVRKLVLLK